MRRLFALLFSSLLATAWVQTSHAQQPHVASDQESRLVTSLDALSGWSMTILGERDSSVVVAMVPSTDPVPLQSGDVITSINGTSVNSVDAFFEAYNAIEVGKKIQLDIQRGEAEMSVSFEESEKRSRLRLMMQPAR